MKPRIFANLKRFFDYISKSEISKIDGCGVFIDGVICITSIYRRTINHGVEFQELRLEPLTEKTMIRCYDIEINSIGAFNCYKIPKEKNRPAVEVIFH